MNNNIYDISKEPLISVVVPVYNAEKYIERCTNSLLSQNYTNLEVILINDGSTDNTENILKRISDIDHRVVVINKDNEGIAATRNKGIELARGEYITFADNDDWIGIDYIHNLVTAAISNDSDISIGGFQRVRADGSVIMTKDTPHTEWGIYCNPTPWAKIYKTSFLRNNDIRFFSYPIGEDIFFILSIIANGAKYSFVDNTYYQWFYNEDSISNTIHKGMDKKSDIVPLLNKLNKLGKDDNELMRYFIYRFVVWYLIYSGRDANKREFIEVSKKLFEWINDNGYSKTISPFSRKLCGEGFTNRIAVMLFKVIDKLNLFGAFAALYCKGH